MSRDQSDAATAKECWQPPGHRRVQGGILEEIQPCRPQPSETGSELLASRTGREEISVVFSHEVCGYLLC